ncbi:Adenosine deaminase-like protein [Vitis vinifera]|uniref:Adenosine deaminase-like protein n=1 Tax=Vitis vinifera TaxID=29760 RepID=A0A438JGL0_VITVI|nr:Adenosine deaminase-like protein [Vitis vinifera]
MEREMEWWISMPKVELHAHLNGSIRDSTLLELAKALGEKGVILFSDVEHVIRKNDRSLNEVFKLFDLIHIITTDHTTVTRITKEVVEDFASENVIYLELRTTPKRNESIGMSKRSYMEAVVKGLRAVDAVDVNFAPHYLGEGNDIYAMETVKLALEMRDQGVVGIDLSGNPTVGDWMTFLPALKFAREQGLSITLHCGEVPNPKEIQAMLEFLPERVGHACFFKEDHWENAKSSKIPVEICLTSNIRTGSISSLDVHHFGDLYHAKHPLILCTDDSGIFSTSLSGEYILAASSFGLGKKEMLELGRNAIEFIFADDEIKRELREAFDSAAGTLEL